MRINAFALAILASASLVFGATVASLPRPVTKPAAATAKVPLPKAVIASNKVKPVVAKDQTSKKATASEGAEDIKELRRERSRIIKSIIADINNPEKEASVEARYKAFDQIQDRILALETKARSVESKKLDEISAHPRLKHGRLARFLLREQKASQKPAPAATVRA